ncbi:putative Plasmid pBRH01, complete sequence [Thiomonas sp. X19]|uniref:hypothetical protein n=1 Tax=Thiomonas sp. X19 TaxID=1050370 RepID=UPI000B6C0833|nr:hypothetical protein [Thiomonas sp. X19]SCC92489.1 putative Plasmid pBRH01, complete sequence [Thiomonas sp. X19]
MKRSAKVVSLALALSLGACAMNPATQVGKNTGNVQTCNPIAAALGGALVGALLGGSHDRAAGAAAGGLLASAACMAVNYHARQVKTAQQVDQEWQAQNGTLPEHATLTRYETKLEPSATVRGGGETNLVSYIEVAEGQDHRPPVVEQIIALYGPDAKLLKSVRKTPSASASAGAFQSDFSLTLPQGVPQGVYTIQSAVYVNGAMARTAVSELQVV